MRVSEIQGECCVLLASPKDFELPLVAKALAAFKGIALYDATRMAKNSRGIVGEKLDETGARRLVMCLQEVGLQGRVVLQNDLANVPSIEFLTLIEGIDEGWRFHIKGSSLVEISLKQIYLIAALSYDETSQKTKQIKEGPSMGQRAMSIGIMMTTGLPINIGGKDRVVTKAERQTNTFYAADLFVGEPLRRFKIDAQDFNYSYLRERKGYNAFNNFRLLLNDLAIKSPSGYRNAGVRVITDSRPIHEMGYDSMDIYEREIQWLLTLKNLPK